MTVTSTAVSSGPFIPNGVTTTFPFAFKALSASDVQAYRLAANGTETIIGGYTVTIDQPSGGSIVFGSGLVAGDPLYIRMTPDFLQEAAFVNQGNWSPVAMTDALDRAAQCDLWLRAQFDQVVRGPDQILELPNAIGRASRLPRFDNTGFAIDLLDADQLATFIHSEIVAYVGEVTKGDPGGNVLAIGFFTAATSLNIPLGTNVVRTSGYDANGVGIADYVADAAVDSAYVTANPRTSFISANARGFRLIFSGIADITAFGAVGDGVFDCTTAAQAALDYLNAHGGGIFYAPTGTFKVTAWLRRWPNTIVRGAGRQSTIITSTHVGGGGATAGENIRNGSVFVSVFPINASTAATIGFEDITVQNTNSANMGAAYYDEGGTFIYGKNFRVIGFKYGVVLDQSELAHFDTCEFSAQHAVGGVAGAGVYLVNGTLLTPGEAADFTNMITFDHCQFNQPSTTYCILDTGGETRSADRCNFNGGISAVRMSGGAKWEIGHNEYESQVNHILDMQLYDLSSTVAGGNVVTVAAGIFSAASGKSSINCAVGGGSLSVGGGAWFSGGGGAYAIVGVTNLSAFYIGHTINSTSAAEVYDHSQRATLHVDPALKEVVATAAAPSTTVGKHVSLSWEGTYGQLRAIELGGDYQPLRIQGQGVDLYYAGTIVAQVGLEAGVANFFNLPGGVEFRLAGQRLLTSPQAAIADAGAGVNAAANPPTQTEFNNLVTQFNALRAAHNTILAALRAHRLILT